ncbi:MAG: hypothetical protein JO186_07870 [Actinobacteria bacterium]|nr:hypothetical protein [Actinomycetota bacterium]
MRTTLVLLVFLAFASPAAAARNPKPYVAELTSVSVDSGTGSAKFAFKAVGGKATSFTCTLTLRKKQIRVKSCNSPVAYEKLAAGSYLFSVYAVGPGRTRSEPARNAFKITR